MPAGYLLTVFQAARGQPQACAGRFNCALRVRCQPVAARQRVIWGVLDAQAHGPAPLRGLGATVAP
jgi:hypothetical protein